jgi:hypothetical protein
MEAPCTLCPARRGLAAGRAAREAQWPARDQEGGNLWLTKPAERQPLLKNVGWKSAPVGTEPAFMWRLSIPAKPRVKIKASAPACASFRGSYWKGRGPEGGAPSQRSRIAGPLPAATKGLVLEMRIPRRESGFEPPSRFAGQSQGTPARWRPLAQPIRRMNLAGAPVTGR